ncbi:MAG: hypothetical protein U1D30_00625 [Planctomycetota bacterium]
MDTFENASPAEKQPNMRQGTCWECGEELLCNEYVVCCTGTVFHVCPDCENKVQEKDSATRDGTSLDSTVGAP